MQNRANVAHVVSMPILRNANMHIYFIVEMYLP
jgi:hypothetical protein